MLRLAAAIAAGALVLTACSGIPGINSSGGSIDGITIGANNAYGVPILEFDPGLSYDSTETKVLWEGDGPNIQQGERILLDRYAVSLKTGDVIVDTFEDVPDSYLLAPEVVGDDLYDVLLGRTVGTRILHVIPPTPGYEEFGAVAMVLDILPSRAQGEVQPERVGLPRVTLADDGEPTITVPGAVEPPPELVAATLIQGTGAQIEAGARVVIHYKAVDFRTNTLFQSSWDPGNAPWTTTIGEGAVIKGLDEALIDRAEGSQVLVIIPPTLAYGEGTLVVVVDVLAVWNPA